mgnify:CR=1 FL=1
MDHFKSGCPEYYLEEFRKLKLSEGKKIAKGKEGAHEERASTEEDCGTSSPNISTSKISNAIPSLLELPTPAT